VQTPPTDHLPTKRTARPLSRLYTGYPMACWLGCVGRCSCLLPGLGVPKAGNAATQPSPPPHHLLQTLPGISRDHLWRHGHVGVNWTVGSLLPAAEEAGPGQHYHLSPGDMSALLRAVPHSCAFFVCCSFWRLEHTPPSLPGHTPAHHDLGYPPPPTASLADYLHTRMSHAFHSLLPFTT